MKPGDLCLHGYRLRSFCAGLHLPAPGFRLDIPHLPVNSALFQQFIVTAGFGYLTVLQNEDPVGIFDGGQLVGDHHHGFGSYQLLDGSLDIDLVFRVEAGSEVADSIGYKNPRHFSAAFKKKFGMLPSRVRC